MKRPVTARELLIYNTTDSKTITGGVDHSIEVVVLDESKEGEG